MAEERWQTFAPLPARAMADEALSALDLRVLAALAAHDRFGANGIGCYASHPRLAGLVNCHLKSLSRSLRVLAELGYIEASQHPLNKRLRVYRVVYLPSDKAVMKGGIGNEPVTDTDPIGNQPVPENGPNGPIGNQHFQESEQLQEDAGVNILGEALSIASETVKDNSVETALLRTNRNKPERPESDGQYLGRLQTWLKQHSPRILTEPELEAATEHRDECQRIEDESEASDGGIGGWAQRLGEELDGIIEAGTDDWWEEEPFSPDNRTVRNCGEPRSFAVVLPCGAVRRLGVRTQMRGNSGVRAA